MAKTPKPKTAKAKSANRTSRRLKLSARHTDGSPQADPPMNAKLPGAFKLFGAAMHVLKAHPKLFAGITAVYAALNLLLVQGIGGVASSSDPSVFDGVFSGFSARLASGFTMFVGLVGSTSGGSSADSGYKSILMLTGSLAIIWALRQVYANKHIRIRDSFYQGMTPLAPFVLVLCMITLQLLPLVAGSAFYAVVLANAAPAIAQLAALTVFFGLGVWTLYMVTSSVFALYIATLPNMTPLKALRSAKDLVRGRRWTLLRKILFLPLALFVLAAVIMMPVILLASPVAAWLFFAVSAIGLAVVHSYMYALYRALL
ncbi:MAG TPA: hypothetical protein VMY99_02955 [Nevskiaceae bacterium]|nr:hypothetical protein [Nevskiaceae bacterium]